MSTRFRRAKPHRPGTLGGLSALRSERGLSKSALANRAGVARLTVIRAENGHAVNAATVEKLAAVLAVGPGELFTANGGDM
jgi:transcriptional regulator with XRE-family HTH domain